MNFHLNINDIIYAAALAFLLTVLINMLLKSFKIITTRGTEFNYNLNDKSRVIQKCYSLFPKANVSFHGETFTRGMLVRITTNQKKIFEGKLIGQNNENIVCLMTSNCVIAHDIENIDEISLIDSQRM